MKKLKIATQPPHQAHDTIEREYRKGKGGRVMAEVSLRTWRSGPRKVRRSA